MSRTAEEVLHSNSFHCFSKSEARAIVAVLQREGFLAAKSAAEQVTVEPVAWKYELAHSIVHPGGGDPVQYSNWQLHFTGHKPSVPDGAIRKLTALYASPAPADQADEIERWKNEASKKDAELTIARSRLASAERTIETMDNNHRSMAALLADTGRERDAARNQLVRARRDAIEECASYLERKADVLTNSLHCGDSSLLIDEAHKQSRELYRAASIISELNLSDDVHEGE